MSRSLLVFDMDGVLADVRESYRAAVAATVQHFTGRLVSANSIEQYKQAGGWNNDWALAKKIIEDTSEQELAYCDVVSVFQSVFLGLNNDGLITRERWIPRNGLLAGLAENHGLAIFTGRPRPEIEITLARFAPDVRWSVIVADDEVEHPKPAPDGLVAIRAAHPEAVLTYIGDNVDDARCARAAGVRFIGIADPGTPDLATVLKEEGASAVISEVNEMESIL
jgi:HAD superfamily phosphatase